MVVSRIARQAAVVIGAVGLTVPILTAPGPAASAMGASRLALASATTTTTVPCPTTTTTPGATTTVPPCPTTTTTVPPSTTTTTRPGPTTTTRPRTTTTTTVPRSPTTTTTVPPSTTTTTRPARAGTGVPSVPVGGPAVKPATPGAAPAPPPSATAILTAVEADLSQVSAIQEYARARAAVNSSRASVAAASAGVRTAAAAARQARAGAEHAQANVAQAATRVQQLALAAYMGLGYVTPAAGPVGDQPSGDGTVSTPGGLTGSAAMDALTLVQVVAVHERKDLVASRSALTQAAHTVQEATAGVAAAQADLASAELKLSASQQTLTLMTRAATTPGLAATLDLPSPSSPPTTAAPASRTGGPTTTVPASWYVESDASAPAASSPTILGHTVLSAAELARWFASTKEKANITVPMTQLTQDYVEAGQQTGVRADLAFAQSIVETAYFTFPSYGQLTGQDNNFAGIGACDTCAHGWSFKNAATGVGAQLELLEAYASPKPVATPLLGRSVGIGGCCTTWLALAGQWASSTTYGISILTAYQDMLNWVIPERLEAAGLLAAPKPAPGKPGPATSAGPAGDGPPAASTTTTTPPSPSTTAAGPPPQGSG